MIDVEFGCLEEKGTKMASAGEDTWPFMFVPFSYCDNINVESRQSHQGPFICSVTAEQFLFTAMRRGATDGEDETDKAELKSWRF